jgi:hypothetical protein
MGRYGPRDRYLDEATEDAVFQIAENAHEYVDRLVVTGIDEQTGRSERLNLLSERIHQEVELPFKKNRDGVPDEAATFAAMDSAYADMKAGGRLDDAVEAQLMRGR